MNSFEVVWTPDALNELARLWLDSLAREEIVAAVTKVDAQLQRDPQGCGMNLSEGLRKLIVPPLVVYFATETNLVEISYVALLS